MVGVLLAVFGQVYQTGADAYQLFLTWTILIIGWVIISRFSGLWFGLLVLLNITLITYWNQALGESSPAMFITLALLNALALFAWEYAHWRGVSWLQHRWLPWLIAPATFLTFIIPTLEFIFSGDRSGLFLLLAPALYLIFTAVSIFFYQKIVPDLFTLTITSLGLIVVITSTFIELLDIDFDDAFVLFVVSVLIIGQTALAVTWLRRVAEAWEEPHV